MVLIARLRSLLRRRDGREIELTAREFALLEYLMRHEGEALSRADILSHVWGADFAGNDSVIEPYIAYLRKRVDAPFGRKSIRTLPKFGYKITDELA